MPNEPFNIYREEITSNYRGIALWPPNDGPNPVEATHDCDHVSIGDVGYLCEGDFIRMFNVTLPPSHPSNGKLGEQDSFRSLELDHFVDVLSSEFSPVEFCSPQVSKLDNAGNTQALTYEETKGHTYICQDRTCGALLSLPHGGRREDVIRTKLFEDYIRDNVDSWFEWSKRRVLPVNRREDLILVTGRTLATSWALAVFDSNAMPSTISLREEKIVNGRAHFHWSNTHGFVEYRNSQFGPNDENPLVQNQCVFIRGFRAKRTPFGTKAMRADSVISDASAENRRRMETDLFPYFMNCGGPNGMLISQGMALWDPKPPKALYNRVSIGDVGYLQEGTFIRMFNVMLPWNDPSNQKLGSPGIYEPLDRGPFASTLKRQFDRVDHYSRHVSAESNAGNLQPRTVDEAVGFTYKFRNRGALLLLPNGGQHEDVIRLKPFEDYIRDHATLWFNWAQTNKLGVERMEDLILVSGCTLVTSWAAAEFVGNTEGEISLASASGPFRYGEANFDWRNIRGPVVYHNSQYDPQNPPIPDQCVFIRGFLAKRTPFGTRVVRAGLDFAEGNSSVYRELSALSQGIALWDPNPPKELYNHVSIGDVGYLQEGTFIRMFNVTLPWDDPSNRRLGNPEPYERLDPGPDASILKRQFNRVDYYTHDVSADAYDIWARTRDEEKGVTYKFGNRGALLSLPNGGQHEDVIRTKPFEDYIRDHATLWFNWARRIKLSVERTEDLILVSGCTLVTSWAAAEFVSNTEGEISLASRTVAQSVGSGTRFFWRDIRGPVVYRNSQYDAENQPMTPNQCVFIRGFQAIEAKHTPFAIRVTRADNVTFGASANRRRMQTNRFPYVLKDGGSGGTLEGLDDGVEESVDDSNVYPDPLSVLSQGIALWNPNPPKELYNQVSIGDVGYLQEGTFIRMFNVMLPWDDPSNQKLGSPGIYEPLDRGPFASTLKRQFDRVDHYSRHVSAESNAGNVHARTVDEAVGFTYKFRNRGALLSLPDGGQHEDVIRLKPFEDYIRDHATSWFDWARRNKLSVERMEDLILVSGRTLVTSWAAAELVGNTEGRISLASGAFRNGGVYFVWSGIQGPVVYHNSQYDPQNPSIPDQCVFIRGFRAKRTPFRIRVMRAAAEPLPDDPDNRRDDEVQAPVAPEYRDPLIGISDYIAEKCVEDAIDEGTMAIAHNVSDNQAHRHIEDVEILTVDMIGKSLREKQMHLLVKDGIAILRYLYENELPISDEKKAAFYTEAELNKGEPVPPTENINLLVVHVYTPTLPLKLESLQRYPEVIGIEALDNSWRLNVTIQDLLRTIHEGPRIPFSRSGSSKSVIEEWAELNATFGERWKNEEELNKDQCDRLDSRNRLQILPKLPPNGSVLFPKSSLPT